METRTYPDAEADADAARIRFAADRLERKHRAQEQRANHLRVQYDKERACRIQREAELFALTQQVAALTKANEGLQRSPAALVDPVARAGPAA